MGVKLQDLAIKRELNYSELAGNVVAIDAPNIIMSFFTFTQKPKYNIKSPYILDRTQRPISHLYGLLYRVNFYYSKKVLPIFCFDGIDSPLKKLITKDRLREYLFAKEWYHYNLFEGNVERARSVALSREYMWPTIMIESKQLLGAMGVPYIESPAAAEAQCAQLVKDEVAKYSVSQDLDSLVFGCPSLIHNLSKSLRRKVQGKWKYHKITPMVIDLKDTLTQLNISYFQLVDMALLIGNDYCKGVKGIGPKKALALIKNYNNLETVVKKIHNQYNCSEFTEDLIKQVRTIFLFPEVRRISDSMRWTVPNESLIRKITQTEHHLDESRIINIIRELELHFDRTRGHLEYIKTHPRRMQTTLF
jgi:flap endonuclease-1